MAELPRTLETPPRTTGNPQTDLPLLNDWLFNAYQIIRDSVTYISEEVNPALVTVNNLPDPNGTTLAQAQQTANDAFSLAVQNQGRLDQFQFGTFEVTDTDVGFEITFAEELEDTDYTVIVQAVSFTGSPPVEAFVVKQKVYATDKFTVTMYSAPGTTNAVTYEWQLIKT